MQGLGSGLLSLVLQVTTAFSFRVKRNAKTPKQLKPPASRLDIGTLKHQPPHPRVGTAFRSRRLAHGNKGAFAKQDYSFQQSMLYSPNRRFYSSGKVLFLENT